MLLRVVVAGRLSAGSIMNRSLVVCCVARRSFSAPGEKGLVAGAFGLSVQAMVGENGGVMVVVDALLGTHGSYGRYTSNVHTLRSLLSTAVMSHSRRSTYMV